MAGGAYGIASSSSSAFCTGFDHGTLSATPAMCSSSTSCGRCGIRRHQSSSMPYTCHEKEPPSGRAGGGAAAAARALPLAPAPIALLLRALTGAAEAPAALVERAPTSPPPSPTLAILLALRLAVLLVAGRLAAAPAISGEESGGCVGNSFMKRHTLRELLEVPSAGSVNGAPGGSSSRPLTRRCSFKNLSFISSRAAQDGAGAKKYGAQTSSGECAAYTVGRYA
jgi:hypothetical protein